MHICDEETPIHRLTWRRRGEVAWHAGPWRETREQAAGDLEFVLLREPLLELRVSSALPTAAGEPVPTMHLPLRRVGG